MGETPVCKKKALSALFPAIAGLATIAVESLNSFLQRKRNKAMASGLMAIKEDQTLAWNSLKQLENDFLMYGKYNVAQLQDIVSTVNGLQNRTMQLEKLLTGKDLYTLQMAHMLTDVSGRMTFIHKMNLYVHSVLERQIRLYEWLLGKFERFAECCRHSKHWPFTSISISTHCFGKYYHQCSGHGHENTSQFCIGYKTPY